MTNETNEVIIPSSPADRQKLKKLIAAMTHVMQKVDDLNENKKEIAEDASKQFKIPKKHINKMAKTMYKRNYADVQTENADFESLYEIIVEGKHTATDKDAA